MAIEIPVDDMDTDKIGGFDRVQPGSYHCQVVAIDEDGGKSGELVLDAEVLRGTTPNQEGKVQREFFGKELAKELPRRKLFALAIALGLTTKAELEQHKKNRTCPVLDFSSCVGRQFCMNLAANEYEGKTSTRIAWDEIYHPTDKRANHIPLNLVMLQKAGITLPPNRNPDGVLAAASKPAAKSGAAAGAASKTNEQAANMDALLDGAF